MTVDNQKLAVSGAIAGAATPFLLHWAVMPILNFLGGFAPQLSLKLANPTVVVNIRESLTGINGGLAGWLTDAIGLTVPTSIWTTVLMSAAGGALLFVVGAWVANQIGFLEGTAIQKTRNVIFAGSIIAGLILGTIGLPPEIGITLANVLIAMLVNAVILSFVYIWLDKQLKLGIVPF